MKNLENKISDWIKDYARNSRIDSLIVGISGGIDSALVSTLCAMTGLDTYTVSMPILQPYDQLRRAHDHIDWLKTKYSNVSAFYIDLTSTFESFKTTVSDWNLEDDLGFANTRSRLRMTTLYQIATVKNGIVVGTGNKVEDFGVGFFTKYGDGGVDISPIGNLMKSEVKLLAKELGIIDSILNAKPTDGLWGDDRTDEDQLRATYDELEWAMKYIEKNPYYSPSCLEKISQRQREVLIIYKNFHAKNLHKMKPIPAYTL